MNYRYTSPLIPDSITFAGETYIPDSKSFDINFETIIFKAHTASGDICHVFYDAIDQLSPDQIDDLEDIRDDSGKQAYANAFAQAIDLAKPSRITNDSRLMHIYPDGHTDRDGLVEDLQSSTGDPLAAVHFPGVDLMGK